MSKSMRVMFAALAALSAGFASADEPASTPAAQASTDAPADAQPGPIDEIKAGARRLGQGVSEGATQFAHGVHDGAVQVGDKTRETAHSVGRATRDTAHAAAVSAHQAGQEIHQKVLGSDPPAKGEYESSGALPPDQDAKNAK